MLLAACGPAAAPPASAPTPVAPAAPAAPAIMTTCPSAADGPSIVVNAVEDANRALVANPQTPLPPACVLVAFSKIPGAVPDSLNAHAIAIASELARRGTPSTDLLTSEIGLYARARRYADVVRVYDQLAAAEAQPPIDVVRLAAAAAHQRADTVALKRILAKNATRADAPPPFRTESTVLNQVPALHQAITEARGFLRQNPKYVQAYPSMVSNYGTLGVADSVAAYARKGLAQGVARNTLGASLDAFVNTMLRHATLFGSTYGWEAQIAAAQRVDEALTTPSTKFLIAALIAQAIEPQVPEIQSQLSGSSLFSRALGGGASPEQSKAAACARIAPLMRLLDMAQAKMRDGGDRFAGGGASQLNAGLSGERERLASFQELCARG